MITNMLYTSDLLDKIDPAVVRSYLISVWLFDGGSKIKTDEGKLLAFRMTNKNIGKTIVVPTKAAADWRHRLVEAIEDISEMEDRSSFYVIAHLLERIEDVRS